MKGIIFRELESMVESLLGPDAWDDLLDATDLQTQDGVFVSAQTYPDEDLVALVAKASEMTGKPVDELLRGFGNFLFADLATMGAHFFQPKMTAKDFLLTVDRVIHVEVRKLHPGSVLPTFTYEDPAPDRLVMIYDSPRKMCDLVAGLLDGVASHFDQRIEQRQTECTKHGAAACRFELMFAPG